MIGDVKRVIARPWATRFAAGSRKRFCFLHLFVGKGHDAAEFSVSI
jgi:hypothetical protein